MAPRIVHIVSRKSQFRRTPRQGRPDGTSEPAVYGVCWTDEDTGPHRATICAMDEQGVRDQLEPLVGSNSMVIKRLSA